jgi:hypothetical protein
MPARLAPLSPASSPAATSGRRSLVDWSVGGGVVLLLGCLVAPALLESRDAARGHLCQDNLRWLGTQLFDFQERWNQQLPAAQPGEHAGAYATKLVELGGVDRRQLAQRLFCPDGATADKLCAGRFALVIPSSRELDAAQGAERIRLVKLSRGIYAIALGHYDSEDFYHPPLYTGSRRRPLMADEPDYGRPGWGGANHRGGQFVLCETLDVRFVTNCSLDGDDHLYRNAAGNPSAPCDPDDVMLSPGDGGPLGPIVPVAMTR